MINLILINILLLFSLMLFLLFFHYYRQKQKQINQTGEVKDNIPLFFEKLKDKLTFPMSWTSGNESDFNIWRKNARNKVLELAFIQPDDTPFKPQIIDKKENDFFISKKIIFNLTAESRVMGLMLTPKGKGPFPAVLLLHDHGGKFDIGKEKMIKPWGDDIKLESAKEWSKKHFSGHFIGNELSKRGYLIFAIDALGWGDRGVITYETQQALSSNLLNLGTSLAGLMAFEDLRSAEFLASLHEVDKTKINAIGFSMGAYRAWQVAALSDKISTGAAICWMTTEKKAMVIGNNLLRGQSAYYMTHPGLFRFLDYPDVASIACPKPMLFYNGEQDSLFSQESVKDAYEKMKKVWKSQNAENKLETKLWPLGHVFVKEMQDEVYKWLDKWNK